MRQLLTTLGVTLLAFLSRRADVYAALSIPKSSDVKGARADTIAAIRAAIQNEPRTIKIGEKEFPFYNGPMPRPGSLAEKIRLMEGQALVGNNSVYPTLVAQTAYAQVVSGKVTSLESITAIYDIIADKLPKPISSNISDPVYGEQRLTVRAMTLRQVRREEYRDTPFTLGDAQVSKLCGRGVTWRNIRQLKALYVEDYHDVAQWNDPEAPEKYVPNVVGFFCYNAITYQFVPIEIQYPDTGIAYTPFDSKDEWTLAKIGLNTAAVSYHQWMHLCHTHALTSSIRVELFRNMASEHPVRALLEHHAYIDHGIEWLMSIVLLAPGTPLDRTFGWGATGSARFAHDYLKNQGSLKDDLPTDLQRRGLCDIPRHKYAQYGSMLYNAINSFVKRYIDVYYKSEFAVKNDFELQNWARDCALVPHLKDFPSSFATKMQLQKLVTHLIYLSGVKHHAMNSAVAWAAISAPYSNDGVRKAMPTRKGDPINLLDFVVPPSLLPTTMAAAAFFYRPAAASQYWPAAYRVPPFNQEPALKDVINDFQASLTNIDKFIQKQESGEKWPFDQLLNRDGSLAQQIALSEVQVLIANSTNYGALFSSAISEQLSAGKLTSLDAISGIYDAVPKGLFRPMSTDISDATFGQERITTKAMKLHQVRPNEYRSSRAFALTDAQLSKLCGRGATWNNIRRQKQLYVEDYHDIAQWNDPEAPENQLVPIEIQYPNTGIAYTPFDSKDEWTLAKIGLNSATVSFHQWLHYSETHGALSSVRVELFRNMADEHPIRALLNRHLYIDFGLEFLVSGIFLSPGTPLDKSYGWGATGSTRFVHDYFTTRTSILNDFPTDSTVNVFVQRYIDVYYKNDQAIKSDFELQNWARDWARDCALVPHLKEFPSTFTAKAQLQRLLTRLIYLSGVKHHAMNSTVIWSAISAPYSTGALHKALPARKGVPVNLMDFVAPPVTLPVILGDLSAFVRPVAPVHSWLGAYAVAPFSQEAALQPAIADLQMSLRTIDTFIQKQERGQKWPYEYLRPSTLPYFSWI
ncbi:hypothetical protein Poli38472_001487 [Pythium oligandrum]|uniref:Lipoxygenase domain-containing protein n=1 Tax=Pythium oligandrum TaxID=41045 RepID=A0A8K1FNF4_PYTOL|nr:hypothetical protein Poli38472_001487 [Pythium oligandrum]|eukprot:TMW69331.1 hypothetical protein Poli38472_001487 [Pythium oligandrum]